MYEELTGEGKTHRNCSSVEAAGSGPGGGGEGGGGCGSGQEPGGLGTSLQPQPIAPFSQAIVGPHCERS